MRYASLSNGRKSYQLFGLKTLLINNLITSVIQSKVAQLKLAFRFVFNSLKCFVSLVSHKFKTEKQQKAYFIETKVA